jgi:hypothetical protein
MPGSPEEPDREKIQICHIGTDLFAGGYDGKMWIGRKFCATKHEEHFLLWELCDGERDNLIGIVHNPASAEISLYDKAVEWAKKLQKQCSHNKDGGHRKIVYSWTEEDPKRHGYVIEEYAEVHERESELVRMTS